MCILQHAIIRKHLYDRETILSKICGILGNTILNSQNFIRVLYGWFLNHSLSSFSYCHTVRGYIRVYTYIRVHTVGHFPYIRFEPSLVLTPHPRTIDGKALATGTMNLSKDVLI